MHADHVTGTGNIKASITDCKSVLGDKSGAKADVFVSDGEILKFGDLVSCWIRYSIWPCNARDIFCS